MEKNHALNCSKLFAAAADAECSKLFWPPFDRECSKPASSPAPADCSKLFEEPAVTKCSKLFAEPAPTECSKLASGPLETKCSKLIKCSKLNFNYLRSSEAAIKDLDLEIAPGEFILLCGKSGSGKSALIRLLNGLIPHYYPGKYMGELYLADKKVAATPFWQLAESVATVFQNPKSQFFNLNTSDEILFALENRNTPRKIMCERLNEAARVFEMEHLLERNIFELSGGEKQMIAIAGVYASGCDIILLDEPTSNLDASGIDKIRQMLHRFKEKGKTVIIAEHRLAFLQGLPDRVFYIAEGQIKEHWSGSAFYGLDPSRLKSLGLRSLSEVPLRSSAVSAGKASHNRCDEGRISHSGPCDKAAPDPKREAIPQYYLELRRIKAAKRVKPKPAKNVKEAKPIKAAKREGQFLLNIKDFKIPFGKIIGLTGPNGSGKSTLARIISGISKGDEAKIAISPGMKHKDLKAKGWIKPGKLLKPKERLSLSYLVFQDVNYQLFTESVAEELKLGAHKGFGQRDTVALARDLDLPELLERHPLSLSGGQKQRVSIAAGLASDCKIMIFDEPTSGMDLFHAQQFAASLRKLKHPDRLILLISHDNELLAESAEQIMWLREDGGVSWL